MRWQDFRRSDNVEDAQGGSSGGGFGGGGMRLSGGAVILVIVVSLLLGKNPLEILSLLDGGSPNVTAPAPAPRSGQGGQPAQRPESDFVRAIVGDTEDFWKATFQQSGKTYHPVVVTEFTDGLRTQACGIASAATGPFYCPGDKHVYLDLGFFAELSRRFGAPGEFARAYVIAHEIGHHVQDELGRLEKSQASGDTRGPTSNSVRLELQADCYAGVWGHSAAQRGALDASDVEQGIAAAAAVGDDRIQRQQRGYVAPESFSHGSSAQRVRWFKVGLDSGDPRQCDTFSTREL